MKNQVEVVLRGMRNPVLRSLLAVPVAALLCGAAAAQGTQNPNNPATGSRPGVAVSHTVRGKIFMPSGAMPEQRMRVVLELNTGGIAGEIFSDSIGNFEFRGLASGVYRVSVPSDNRTFETGAETVEAYGSFSRTFMVQIYLREKGGDNPIIRKDKLVSAAELQDIPKAAKKAYEKGLKLAQQQKPQEAIGQFEEALKIFPDYLLAINKLGEQQAALKRPEEARSAFQKAIAINPRFALPHINLGMLLLAQSRFDEAIGEFEEGNRADDSYPMSHLNLGLALMYRKDPDLGRAEKEFSKCLQLGGRNFVNVHKYLFNLYVRQNALEKAARQLESYLTEAPEAPDAMEVRQQLERVRKMMAQKQAPVRN